VTRRDAAIAIAGTVLGAAALALVMGCGGTPPVRPNVLLVTLDTQRADHSSCYGYPRPTTPRLDALAAEGARFDAAYTPTPTTAPAHATLFTARYPFSHGLVKNGQRLPETETTLAERLRDAGYLTAAVVSAYPLARRFGCDQGFAHYDDEFLPAEGSIHVPEWEGQVVASPGFDRRAPATTARAVRWLSAAPRDRPFFLWVHYYDPHEPYDAPARYPELDGQDPDGPLARLIAAYDAEIRFTDDHVGRLVDAQDRTHGRANTLVVIASDHGEGLMQHGWMGHGVNLYEELVRAILVFRWPGRIPSGRRVAEPVGLIDVASTVLALLGIPGPAGEGVDMTSALGAAPAPLAERALYFQRRRYDGSGRDVPARGPMLAVRAGRWKLVEAPRQGVQELFDLVTDPAETRNLYATHAAEATRLTALLQDWQARTAPSDHGAGTNAPEVEQRLRALGYVD
jgi:arylsulfatase A-like enzyme